MFRRFISLALITLALNACRAPVEPSPTPAVSPAPPAPTLEDQPDGPPTDSIALTPTEPAEEAAIPDNLQFPSVVDPRHYLFDGPDDARLQIGMGETYSVLLAPNGEWAAIYGSNYISAYDIDSLELLWRTRIGDPLFLSGFTMSESGQHLALVGDDRIFLYDTLNGKLVREIMFDDPERYLDDVEISPDGGQIVAYWFDATYEHGGPYGRNIEVYEVESGRLLYRLEGPDPHPVWIDGELYIATGDPTLNQITIWNETDARQQYLFDADYGGEVHILGWSPDKREVVLSAQNTLITITVDRSRTMRAFEGHEERPIDVVWSPDSQLLATADETGSVYVTDPNTGALVYSLPVHIGERFHLAFSPDGTRLATLDEEQLRIWDAQDGSLILALLDFSSFYAPGYFRWTLDSQRIITPYLDDGLYIWDAADGALLDYRWAPGWVDDVQWSADSRFIAFDDHNVVKIHDARTGEFLMSLDTFDDAVSSMAWSPDGRLLAASEGWIYDSDVKPRITIWEVPTQAILHEIEYDIPSPIIQMVFSPDGQYLAAGQWTANVSVWEVSTGQLVVTKPDSDWDVLFLIDLAWYLGRSDQVIASGTNGPTSHMIFDIEQGETLRELELYGPVDCSVLTPDGRLGLLDTYDGVTIWDVVEGEVTQTFDTYCLNAAWSPDGRYAALAADTITIWDVQTGTVVRELDGDPGLRPILRWSPDGKSLAWASWNGAVILWDVSDLDAGPD